MPSLRQSVVARLGRLYPFYSGCGTLANLPALRWIAGASARRVWARVPGGHVLAPLDDHVGRAAYFVGDLDRKVTWLCSRLVRPGDTVLDIGANIGLVTVWLAHLVGSGGRVHAFEPNPALCRHIEAARDYNHLDNVTLHCVALGASAGTLQLAVPEGNAGAASLVRGADGKAVCALEVPVRRLSDELAPYDVRMIRLIKIDVEGFEAAVLKGALELLERVRPHAILFEHNGDSALPFWEQQPIRLLRGFEYGLFSMPRCLFRMRVERLDPATTPGRVGNDLLAVPEGPDYEEMARVLRAGVARPRST